jgi:hypothetical protein
LDIVFGLIIVIVLRVPTYTGTHIHTHEYTHTKHTYLHKNTPTYVYTHTKDDNDHQMSFGPFEHTFSLTHSAPYGVSGLPPFSAIICCASFGKCVYTHSPPTHYKYTHTKDDDDHLLHQRAAGLADTRLYIYIYIYIYIYM